MPAGSVVLIALLTGCSAVLALAAAGRPEFFAVEGELASLPCNISTPLADDAASLILWYREDLPNPIYTLDVRGRPRHFPSPEVEGRAFFDTAQHPPMLKLFPVKKADRGDYKCRVDLRRSRTFIHYTRLIVIVPPKVVITDEYGQTMRDVIGPYDEGSSLELFCEASDGEPHPWVTWWRGNVLIDDTFNITPQQVVRNELLIPELKRSDLLAEYSCQAANTNLTKPRVQAIALDLNLRPVSVRVLPPQPPLSAGRPSQLQCEASGARPLAAVSWWRGGHRLPLLAAETAALDANRTLSTLPFVPRVEDHGQHVMCEAAHPTLEGEPVQDVVALDVHYAPQLALTLGTSDPHASAIKEGVSVYFDCNVRANPPPESVLWWVDGRPLNASPGGRPRSLVLQKVARDHQGSYQCSAANDQGEGRSEAVKLDVQYSPVCLSSSPTYLSVTQGEGTNLSCSVDARPSPSAFQWTLNSSLRGTVDLRRRRPGGGGSDTLAFVPRYLGDYGTVLCWGRNDAGVQRRPCVWHVSPEGEVSTDMGLVGPSPEEEVEEEEEVWRGSEEEEGVLTPAVGVVIGVVLSLVILVLVVIVVVKMHTHPPERRTYFEEEKLKYPSPIKKEPTDSIGDEKSPDIIPLPSDIEVYATTVAVELCPTSPILPKQSVEAYYTVENQTCV